MASELGEKLRAAFTENLNLKLLSLGFALVLYALVHGAQDAQRSMSVSLVVLLPPDAEAKVLVSQLPSHARLTLRGPRSVLDDLRAEDLGNLQVDLRTGTDRRVFLDPGTVPVPAGVRVEQIDPPFMDLTWEEQVLRDLPVQVSVVGTPAPGFIVKGQVTAEPNNVRVRGPRSEVQVLQHVRADAFDVSGLTEGKYPRQLALDRFTGGRVNVDVASVQVTATIRREVTERTFERVPVAVAGPPKAKAQPTEVDVRLVCPPEIVRALRRDQIIPQVQVAGPGSPAASTGAEFFPVSVSIDKCEAHAQPATVFVRW